MCAFLGTLQGNLTDLGAAGDLLVSEVKKPLIELKEEIKGLKEDLTGGPDGDGLFSEVKKPLVELKDEFKILRGNLTGGPDQKGLIPEVKQELTELKEEVRALRHIIHGGTRSSRSNAVTCGLITAFAFYAVNYCI